MARAGAVRLYGLPAAHGGALRGRGRQVPPRPCTSPPVPQASRRHSARRRPADTVVAPRRTAERLPRSVAGRAASAQAARRLPPGARRRRARSGTGAVRGLERLQDRLLLRILLQNREDAARMRVLEGRLHRLEESTGRKCVVPAAPPAGSRFEAAAGVTHQLIAARARLDDPRDRRPYRGRTEQRTTQWQLLLNAKTVAGQVGRTQREALLTALVGGIRREALRTGEERRLRSSRNVMRQVSAAQHQALIEQVVLLHRLQRGHIRMGLPGWRALRRSFKRAVKFFWASLPGRVRRRPSGSLPGAEAARRP